MPLTSNNLDYANSTQEQLMKRIHELESQMDEYLQEKSQDFRINFPWAGNLGQWFWFLDRNKVIFNDKKVTTLGYDPKELGEIGFEFFTQKLHPDDFERVMENMRRHLRGESEAYESEYRIKHKDGHYLWYYDRGVITKKDEHGRPLVLQGVVFDITESKKIEERLRELSERDSLTGFYNRRMFFEKLRELMEKKKTEKTPFCLIMFDIDRFKKINDEHGHLVGDDVLRRLSGLLFEGKRASDLVYRYGGEEFFILLPETELNGAVQAAKRIHQDINDLKIPHVGSISVSMGVIEFRTGESIDEAVKRVDDLMYEAKNAGRNTLKY